MVVIATQQYCHIMHPKYIAWLIEIDWLCNSSHVTPQSLVNRCIQLLSTQFQVSTHISVIRIYYIIGTSAAALVTYMSKWLTCQKIWHARKHPILYKLAWIVNHVAYYYLFLHNAHSKKLVVVLSLHASSSVEPHQQQGTHSLVHTMTSYDALVQIHCIFVSSTRYDLL